MKIEIREEREDGGKSGSRFWLESKESKTLSLRSQGAADYFQSAEGRLYFQKRTVLIIKLSTLVSSPSFYTLSWEASAWDSANDSLWLSGSFRVFNRGLD